MRCDATTHLKRMDAFNKQRQNETDGDKINEYKDQREVERITMAETTI